jgi:uncharacterized RDD family membrane protein YckC
MEITYPTLKTRIQSIFIDTLLILVLMFITGYVFDKINPSQEGEDGWIRAVIFVILFGLYEPIAMTMGCTLGNYLMKIRVKKSNDTSKKINLLQAVIRVIIKFLLGWVSFVTIGTNRERRAIHDFASGSVMIEK